jgi:hypothetical protein
MTETQRIELKQLSIKSVNNLSDYNLTDLSLFMGFIIDTLEHSSLYDNIEEHDYISVSFSIFKSFIEIFFKNSIFIY